MKVFNWISRKAKKSQPELQATDQQHPSSLLHAAVHPSKASFNQRKPPAAPPAFTFEQDDLKKRREIVKIFVNHEEYGLLAIGTLGLYELTEIELFEVKPNVSLHPDGLKVHHHEEDSQRTNSQAFRADQFSHTQDRQGGGEEEEGKDSGTPDQAIVLHKSSKHVQAVAKKVLPLDPHLGLKRSKLTDRLLHPLNYLSFSSRRGRKHPTDSSEIHLQQAGQHVRSNNNFSMLKKLLKSHTITSSSSSSMKQITMDESRSPKKMDAVSSKCDESPRRSSSSSSSSSKLKRAMAQFSCMSVQGVDEEEDGLEDDGNGSTSVRFGEGGLSAPDSTWSAPGDPNAGYQPTCATDIKPEYWIRTDSDYVVLEL